MNSHSPGEDENGVRSIFVILRVRHSRMFLAGIQAEFGLDPRLKHSAVTALKRFSLLVRMQRHVN